jgi:DNA-binding XRE family transcriptional regulator
MLSSNKGKQLRVDKKFREMVDKYPGEEFTFRQIGEFVGLSPQAIMQIERNALKKLGKKGELCRMWKEIEGCLTEDRLLSMSESQLRQLQDGLRRNGYHALGLEDSSGINPVMSEN